MTAMQWGLQSCEGCGLLSRPGPGEHEGRCPRCGGELVFRKPASFQRTWAYLIAAAICYVPANVLPVLTTTTAAGAESDTIMQGVVLLWSPTGTVWQRKRRESDRHDRDAARLAKLRRLRPALASRAR